MNDYLLTAAGLVLLMAGGELLVRGAQRFADRIGLSPLLIGLVLVGFGTSTPELATSVQASLAGTPGIAIGNIVGSNIANVLLILGISAAIASIVVHDRALSRDGMVVLLATAVFVGIGFWGHFDRSTGALLLMALAGYVTYAYFQESSGAPAGHTAAFERGEARNEVFRRDGERTRAPLEQSRFDYLRPLALAFIGLAILVAGSTMLVTGAMGIARKAGISESILGLTIVAIGTSLPELATSLIAAVRRHGDVALGNILGSNVYNILGIGGATALIAPTSIPPEIARVDSPVMLAVSLLLLAFAWTGRRIGRREGVLLLLGYGVYLIVVARH